MAENQKPPEAEFRYERKFLVRELDAHQVLLLFRLHPAMFYQTYPPRQVNSLYLDSPELEDYYANVSGAADRKKVRLRWYGNVFGDVSQPVLEFKIKRGQVGTKDRYLLRPLRLEPGFCDRHFQEVANASGLPGTVRIVLKGLNVVLLNYYWRHYFASRDQRYRLTLDTALTFIKINETLGNTFTHRQSLPDQVIVELKYDPEYDPAAQRIAGFFPFQATRSSKYVQGMEKVYF